MDEFLGATGAATIVMLKMNHDESLPTIQELKRDLEVTSIKYYKGFGWYRSAISRLEQLLIILESLKGNEKIWGKFDCTDFLRLSPNANRNLVYEVKHGTMTIAGFNLTNESFEELDQLLKMRNDIRSMQNATKFFINRLSDNAETINRYGLTDLTLSMPPIELMNSYFENYGLTAIQSLNERLLAWHQKYTWKLKSLEEIEANSLALSAIET
jgi:hypothetical protein